jgi:hypothetical protein
VLALHQHPEFGMVILWCDAEKWDKHLTLTRVANAGIENRERPVIINLPTEKSRA